MLFFFFEKVPWGLFFNNYSISEQAEGFNLVPFLFSVKLLDIIECQKHWIILREQRNNFSSNINRMWMQNNTFKDQVINAFFLLPQVKGWPFSTKVHCQETNKVKVQAIHVTNESTFLTMLKVIQ